MKISHEIPKKLFPYQDLISDYPYVLGHLLNKDPEYKEFYVEQLKKARFSIFDNSCFELGKSMDHQELIDLAIELKPSHLVLPDTLHDMKTTLHDTSIFWASHRDKMDQNNIKPMGVLQGNTFDELVTCYKEYLKMGIEYICIPFDCIKDSDWHTVRYLFFKFLLREIGRTPMVKFHFLGIQNPSELLLYSNDERQYISSIDTSSPIINGWSGQLYGTYGLSQPKPKDKLADNLDKYLFDKDIANIIHNVKRFKELTNGYYF